jgi:hypothetical protein
MQYAVIGQGFQGYFRPYAGNVSYGDPYTGFGFLLHGLSGGL